MCWSCAYLILPVCAYRWSSQLFIFILGQFPCLIHGRHVPKDDPSLTFEVLEFLSVYSFWVTLLMLTTFDETRSLSQDWELMGCTFLGLYRLDLSSSLLFDEFQGFVRHSSISSMSRWQVYINIVPWEKDILCMPGIESMCPPNTLYGINNTTLTLMPKLNPLLSPRWLTPEHYRQAFEIQTHNLTHVSLWLEWSHTWTVFVWRVCFVWSFARVSICMSNLVWPLEVVYCTAALPTDGHYHVV